MEIKKKNIKRPPFHCQTNVDQEYMWRSRTSQEPSKSVIKKDGFSIRFLTMVIWNLEKWKRQKLNNSIFVSPLIVNQTFSETEFIIGKSGFAHIMHFQ